VGLQVWKVIFKLSDGIVVHHYSPEEIMDIFLDGGKSFRHGDSLIR
jgi:hypothetical protein